MGKSREPLAPLATEYVELSGQGRQLIVIEARPQGETRPFTYDGRPYQRVQTTISVMPRERYDTMLLERAHARRRWENQPAVDVGLDHLDHEEILRIREAAIAQRRISAGPSTDVGDILQNFRSLRDVRLEDLPAAVVVFGDKEGYVQSLSFKPITLANSLVFLVTKVRSRAVAMAAIIRSLPPIGVPSLSNRARMTP